MQCPLCGWRKETHSTKESDRFSIKVLIKRYWPKKKTYRWYVTTYKKKVSSSMLRGEAKRKRNILLISYNFPGVKTEINYVGRIRPGNLAKFLVCKGYNLYVICGPRNYNCNDKIPINLSNVYYVDAFIPPKFWSKYDAVNIKLNKVYANRTKYSFESFAINLFKRHRDGIKYMAHHFYPLSHTRLPDRAMFWRGKALRVAEHVIQKNMIDVIISSAGPPSSTIVASKLRTRFNIKWIADFRDLWSLNHIAKRMFLYDIIERKYEKKVLSEVNHIVTVSRTLAKQMENLHNKDVEVIENGFDEEEYNTTEKINEDIFSILYTGQLYSGKRDPHPLFEAVNLLIKERSEYKSRIKIVFYGNNIGQDVYPLINFQELKNIVMCFEARDREKIIEIQKRAAMLLSLEWNDVKAKGVVTAKLFEYLGARRPILAIGYKGGDLDNILRETGAGIMLNDPIQIKTNLLKWMDLFFRRKDYDLGFNMDIRKVSKYSSRNMVERFERLIS